MESARNNQRRILRIRRARERLSRLLRLCEPLDLSARNPRIELDMQRSYAIDALLMVDLTVSPAQRRGIAPTIHPDVIEILSSPEHNTEQEAILEQMPSQEEEASTAPMDSSEKEAILEQTPSQEEEASAAPMDNSEQEAILEQMLIQEQEASAESMEEGTSDSDTDITEVRKLQKEISNLQRLCDRILRGRRRRRSRQSPEWCQNAYVPPVLRGAENAMTFEVIPSTSGNMDNNSVINNNCDHEDNDSNGSNSSYDDDEDPSKNYGTIEDKDNDNNGGHSGYDDDEDPSKNYGTGGDKDNDNNGDNSGYDDDEDPSNNEDTGDDKDNSINGGNSGYEDDDDTNSNDGNDDDEDESAQETTVDETDAIVAMPKESVGLQVEEIEVPFQRFASEQRNVDLELTPSPDLRELPIPESPDVIELTPSPDRHSPDLKFLPTPEPLLITTTASSPHLQTQSNSEQTTRGMEGEPSLGQNDKQNVAETSKPKGTASSAIKASTDSEEPGPSQGTSEPARLPKRTQYTRMRLLPADYMNQMLGPGASTSQQEVNVTLEPSTRSNLSSSHALKLEPLSLELNLQARSSALSLEPPHSPEYSMGPRSPELSFGSHSPELSLGEHSAELSLGEHSLELSLGEHSGHTEGTPEPVRPPKRRRLSQMRSPPTSSKDKTVKNAKTGPAKSKESAEVKPTHESKTDTSSPELTEGTPEPPTPPKMKKPQKKMKLYPSFRAENRGVASDEKYRSGSGTFRQLSSSDSEIDENEHEEPQRPISKKRFATEPARSPELGTPAVRSTDMNLRLIAGRPPRMQLLPANGPGRRDLYAVSASSTSSRARTYGTQAIAGPSTSRAQPFTRSSSPGVLSRTVPRTRVLVTPERLMPPGCLERRKPRTSEQEDNILAQRLSRKSKQRKRKRVARRSNKRSYSFSPSSSSQNGGESGNMGDRSASDENEDNYVSSHVSGILDEEKKDESNQCKSESKDEGQDEK